MRVGLGSADGGLSSLPEVASVADMEADAVAGALDESDVEEEQALSVSVKIARLTPAV